LNARAVVVLNRNVIVFVAVITCMVAGVDGCATVPPGVER